MFTSDRPPLRYGPSPDNSRWLAGMEQTGVDANPAQSRNAMPACAEISPMLRGLSPVGGKPIVARFDTGHLCSDGGLLALREIENRLGIVQRLAACIDER